MRRHGKQRSGWYDIDGRVRVGAQGCLEETQRGVGGGRPVSAVPQRMQGNQIRFTASMNRDVQRVADSLCRRLRREDEALEEPPALDNVLELMNACGNNKLPAPLRWHSLFVDRSCVKLTYMLLHNSFVAA